MATQQTVALMDTSTYTNFASWAKWALAAFTTFGWIQTADYGQVNWTNLAASAAVPLSSNNSGWTSYQAAASVGTGAGGFAASGGSLIIAMATTTGMAAGKAVQLLALAGTGANAGVSAYNNYILTITSVVASTSITVACPAGWSFSYQVTAGNATIQPAFMIFVSNDTLTPTMPLYVKMEFGGYQSNNSPWARVTIGTAGTNGYGTLSGTTTAAMCFCCYQSDTVNWRPCIASGDSGNIRFCCFVPIGIGTYDPYSALWLVISRSKDNSGNSTGNYVMCWNGAYYGTAALCNFQTLFAGGGTNLIDAQGVLIAAFSNLGTANNNSGAMNGTTMVTPIFQNVGGLSNPTSDFLGGSSKDFQNGTQSTIAMYGANHVYFAVAPVSSSPKVGVISQTSAALLFRYE